MFHHWNRTIMKNKDVSQSIPRFNDAPWHGDNLLIKFHESNVKQHVLNKIWVYALQLFLPGHRTAALNNNNFEIGWSWVLIYTICGDIKNTENSQWPPSYQPWVLPSNFKLFSSSFPYFYFKQVLIDEMKSVLRCYLHPSVIVKVFLLIFHYLSPFVRKSHMWRQ